MIREKGPKGTQIFEGFAWEVYPTNPLYAEKYGFFGVDERPVTSEYEWIASITGYGEIILTESYCKPHVVEGWECEPSNPDREWMGDDDSGYHISAIKMAYRVDDHECWIYCAIS